MAVQQPDRTGRIIPTAAANPASDRDAGTNEFVTALRYEFPHWAILPGSQGGAWVAIQGKDLTINGADGIELRDQLLIATGRYGCRR